MARRRAPTTGEGGRRDEPRIAGLAAAARAGDALAFEELVAAFENGLFRFLVLRVGERGTAEDLLQASFVRAWQQLHRYDLARPFGPWLYTIAARLAASEARRHARRPVEPLPGEPAGPTTDPLQAAAARESGANLWALAARLLGAEACSALWLRYAEELTPAEIGVVLGRGGAAVRVLLFRGRRRLLRHLQQEEAARDRLASDGTPAAGSPAALPLGARSGR